MGVWIDVCPEGGLFVARCHQLGLHAYGVTFEQAKQSMEEKIRDSGLPVEDFDDGGVIL